MERRPELTIIAGPNGAGKSRRFFQLEKIILPTGEIELPNYSVNRPLLWRFINSVKVPLKQIGVRASIN